MTAEPQLEPPRRPVVLVVAKSPATRAGIRLALEPALECVEARNVEEAIALASSAHPVVCLVSSDPEHEEAMVADLSRGIPATHIVLLTPELRDDRLLAAVRAGAVGYLSQKLDPERLPFVVEGVMRGEAAIPRALVTRLVDELRERRRRRQMLIQSRGLVDLTTREWEVLELLRHGASTRDIARTLSIADVTVRRHVGTLLHKLDVDNRSAAVALVADWSNV